MPAFTTDHRLGDDAQSFVVLADTTLVMVSKRCCLSPD